MIASHEYNEILIVRKPLKNQVVIFIQTTFVRMYLYQSKQALFSEHSINFIF